MSGCCEGVVCVLNEHAWDRLSEVDLLFSSPTLVLFAIAVIRISSRYCGVSLRSFASSSFSVW